MPEGIGYGKKALRDMHKKAKKKKIAQTSFSVMERAKQMKDTYKKRRDIMKELFKEE